MKILVTGAWKCTEEQLNTIKNLGHSVIFMQNETDPLPCAYEEVDGVICNGLFLSHSIEKFKSLKFIQLTSAGFDRVPMDYVTAHGIEIYNAKGVYSIPMAEFAICGVLDLYKKSRYFYDNQKAKKWEKHYGLLELFGKKVCIIGVGNVGTECAKRFKAFGCLIYGVDINVRNDDTFEKIYPIVDNFETTIDAHLATPVRCQFVHWDVLKWHKTYVRLYTKGLQQIAVDDKENSAKTYAKLCNETALLGHLRPTMFDHRHMTIAARRAISPQKRYSEIMIDE